MSSVTQIRDALKATLDANIASLFVYDTVPGSPNLPCAVVMPDTASFVTAFARGTDQWNFKIYVLCSYADSAIGQDSLDTLASGAGNGSIRQVIFQNSTLGLADVNATVTGLSDYGGQFEAASITHVGAILQLQVLTSGKD